MCEDAREVVDAMEADEATPADLGADAGAGSDASGAECDGACADAMPRACDAAAGEACNDVDDDCDGLVDEGCDDDGDGYCDERLGFVGAPALCPLGRGDCDDDNADARPDQTLFFPVDRGDGSFDYDCDGAESVESMETSAGCSVEFAPFACNAISGGWTGGIPACGKAGDWQSRCDSQYDAVCIFFCFYSDPRLCTECWSCTPATDSVIQRCR